MSEAPNVDIAAAAKETESTIGTETEMRSGTVSPAAVSKIRPPSRSNIPTPASSVTGIPTKIKPPAHYGSTNSVSKIGRLCCTHTTPKAGPPPRGELKRFCFNL